MVVFQIVVALNFWEENWVLKEDCRIPEEVSAADLESRRKRCWRGRRGCGVYRKRVTADGMSEHLRCRHDLKTQNSFSEVTGNGFVGNSTREIKPKESMTLF